MKTIGAFIQFVLSDPIMMGLCLAIIVLILLFILVLILGKRAEKIEQEELKNEKEEKLLKTEINLDVPDCEQNQIQPQELPIQEMPVRTEDVTPIPIEIESDPVRLETPEIKTESTINPFGSSWKTAKSTDQSVSNNKDEIVKDGNFKPLADIIVSEANPIEETGKTVEMPVFDDKSIGKSPVTASIQKTEESYRDIYGFDLAEEELPEFKTEISKTEVIKNIPGFEESQKEDDLDDIDLPMFNTKTKEEPFDAIKGESFNISK